MSGALAKGLAAAALAASVLGACRSPDKFVLQGQRYDAVNDCVEPTSSIDLVQGSDPGLGCAAQCVVTPTGVLYVTTECGSSFPPLDSVTAGDAGDSVCSAAVAALQRMAVCGGGGDDAGDDASDATTEGAAMDAFLDTAPEATPDSGPPERGRRGSSEGGD